jgi:hypothetical protein
VTSRYATSPTGPAEPAPGSDTRADARTLAELRQPGRPVLIKGATILSQDPAVGDHAAGDILIRDGKIAQVGEDLTRQADEAVVISAAGTIAIPGFVDAHVHAWEGQLRGAAPTLDFGAYLNFTAFGYGPHYRPHDNYTGTLATALVALNAGTTTIVDNSHNSRTPEHSSAAVEALIDSGIRGVHASGAPVGADLIRTTDVNTAPGTNAVATVTAFAHAGNIDTVLVAGQVRKWRGKLTGHDMNAVAAQVLASRDYLFATSGQRPDVLTDIGTSPR